MGIFDLFSKRKKRERGEIPDIYVYDEISDSLRVQIVHIWFDSLGNQNQYAQAIMYNGNQTSSAYKFIVKTLCREYGLFELPTGNESNRDYLAELVNFLLQEKDIEKVIDVIELSFKVIVNSTTDYNYLSRSNSKEIANNAVEELNQRFKEQGVGYQFIENEIIRIDSQLIHSEVVKPALKLLSDKNYKGAQEEFLSAYEHYRHKKNKEALNDCLKSFESTMKAICDKRKWIYQTNATSKNLINICFDNKLIPEFWQNNLTSLRSLLEGSIPTGRNKLSGHGQGSDKIEVPDYLVSYMLHMTASTIVFLIEAEKNYK